MCVGHEGRIMFLVDPTMCDHSVELPGLSTAHVGSKVAPTCPAQTETRSRFFIQQPHLPLSFPPQHLP